MSNRTRFIPTTQALSTTVNTPQPESETGVTAPKTLPRNTLIESSNMPRPPTPGISLLEKPRSISENSVHSPGIPKLNVNGLKKRVTRSRQSLQRSSGSLGALESVNENFSSNSSFSDPNFANPTESSGTDVIVASQGLATNWANDPPPYASCANDSFPSKVLGALDNTYGNAPHSVNQAQNRLIQDLSHTASQDQIFSPRPTLHSQQFTRDLANKSPPLPHERAVNHRSQFLAPDSNRVQPLGFYMHDSDSIFLHQSQEQNSYSPGTPGHPTLQRVASAGAYNGSPTRDKRSSLDRDDCEPYDRHPKRIRLPSSDQFQANPHTPHDNEGQHRHQSEESRAGNAYITRNEDVAMFLGQDVDDYISKNMEKFEAAKQRWQNCTMQEWEDGASGITDKFNALLDFVKRRMSDKINLWASLHSRIAEHKKDMEERNKMLSKVKETLVTNTGGVVTGSYKGLDSSE